MLLVTRRSDWDRGARYINNKGGLIRIVSRASVGLLYSLCENVLNEIYGENGERTLGDKLFIHCKRY